MNKVKHTIARRVEEMRDGEEKSEEVDMEAKQLLEKFRELVYLPSYFSSLLCSLSPPDNHTN